MNILLRAMLIAIWMAIAIPVYAATGLDWLTTQQNPDGSFGNTPASLATPIQSTAEVLRAYQMFGQASAAGFSAALNYLNSDTDNDTKSLARKIIVNAKTNNTIAPWVNELATHQNVDGGFGCQAGYASSVLDTAFALEALAAAGNNSEPQVAGAVSFLTSHQQPSGGWQLANNDTHVYVTAIVTHALWSVRHQFIQVQTALINAQKYLLARRGTNGLWPETFESALSLAVLVPSLPDLVPVTASINSLRSLQLADGSWEADAYTTALALRALHLAGLPQPNPDYVTIQGKIIDAQTGLPLSGVTTALLGAASRSLVTGNDGVFLFRGLPTGSFSLTFTLANYAPLATITSGGVGQVVDLGTLALIKSQTATTGTIRGVVTDAATGAALADVNLIATGVATPVLTDANGIYQISNAPPGAVTIAAAKPGYATATGSATLAAGGVLVFSPSLSTAIAQATAIEGSVTNGTTGLPLPGVAINVSGAAIASALTDAQGSYRIAQLNPGAVTVTATLTGYTPATVGVTLTQNSAFVFSPKLFPLGTTPPNPGTAAISGVVLDAGSNAPLPGVTITSLFGTSTQTLTSGAGGQFVVNGITAAQGTLKFSLAGYVTTETSTVLDGQYSWVGQQCIAPIVGASPQEVADTAVSIINAQARACGQNHPCPNPVKLVGVTQNSFTVQSLCTGSNFILPVAFGAESLGAFDIGQVRLRKEKVTALLPDLTVTTVNGAATSTDPQTLILTGSLSVEISNIGTANAPAQVDLLVFYDANRNGLFDQGETVLGQVNTAAEIGVGVTLNVTLPVQGTLPFRDAPILVFVDSAQSVVELSETNNVTTTQSACQVKPDIGTFAPVLKWEWKASPVLPAFTEVVMVPLVARTHDTNGDGKIDDQDTPDVIFTTFSNTETNGFHSDGVLRIVSGKDGGEILTVSDPRHRVSGYGNLAVGDIDGDGLVDIVALRPVSLGGGVIAFSNDGKAKWISTPPGSTDHQWGGVSLADLDGDGKSEIILGNTVLNFDGTLRWQGSGFRGDNGLQLGQLSIVADINRDGKPAIIAGGQAYSSTGATLWKNDAVGDGFAAVADFNRDGVPEIVVVSNRRVFLLTNQGAIIWGPVGIPGGGFGGAPTIADMDGDGVPEIGVAGANRYGVLKADGSILWTAVTQDLSSNSTGSSVFDFNGNGKAEVVYADELAIRVYDGKTGSVVFQIPNTTGTAFEYPVIADVDGDNHADIVLAGNGILQRLGLSFPVPVLNSGVRVLQDKNNSWVNTRKIWNQHSYHITNVNDDGSIPRVERNSWQVHNSYRLNALLGQSATAVPDLTASLFKLLDNGTQQPASLTLRIGNAGAAPSPDQVQVAFYQGDPAAGGVLLGSMNLAPIAPGEYRDIRLDNIALNGGADLFAVVDSANKVTECNESNNRVQIAAAAAANLGTVSVSTDAGSYGPNSPAQLSARVTNTGGLTANFMVSLQIEDNSGAVVAAFAPQNVGPLPGGAAAIAGIAWDTGSTLTGAYRLHGRLRDARGQLIHEASTPFQIIKTNGPAVSLRVSTDRPVYHTTDTVNIQSLAANLTPNSIVDNAVLRLTVIDPAGQTVFTKDGPLGQLPPGALRDLLLPYALNATPVAHYRILGQVLDGTTLLAGAEAGFDVAFNLGKSLTGKVVVQLPTLEAGGIQVCTATTTNHGNLPITGLEIHHVLINVDTSQLHNALVQTINLDAGASSEFAYSLNTQNLVAGNYTCALQALISGVRKTLAFVPFVVKVPPIKFTSDLHLGAKGRLLVLLDNGRHRHEDGEDDDEHEHEHEDEHEHEHEHNAAHDDRDPHGPKDAPGLAAQRAFLEKLLKDAGWSYTITDTAAAFTREFHTGGYSVYALLAEHQKLSEPTQKELREAVFRGEGLVIAGAHDHRNLHHKRLNDALGLKLIGHLSHAQTVVLSATDLGLTGEIPLIPGDKALRMKRLTAVSAGIYRLGTRIESDDADDCRKTDDEAHDKHLGKSSNNNKSEDQDDEDNEHEECEANPQASLDAVTLNAYGRGQSAFTGFDLLAQATRDGDTSLAAQLLTKLVSKVHPVSLATGPGAVIPVALTLKNQGITVSIAATVTLPAGVSVIDAGTGQASGPLLTWTFPLAVDEQKTVTAWIRLPDQSGPVTLNATVTASAGSASLTANPTLTINVMALEALGGIKTTLEALVQADHPDKKALAKAIARLDKATKYLDSNKAVIEALKATDALLSLTDPIITNLRISIDTWLRQVARYAYN